MAGEFRITSAFTRTDFDLLRTANLGVTVLVDLSHNGSTTTVDHPDGLQVISKAVELDIVIDKGTAGPADFFSLKTAKTSSAAYMIYEGIAKLGGLDTLKLRNIKVEAPRFDKSVVDSAHVVLARPWRAATAPNAVAFNALPEDIRKCMGMYLWNPMSRSYSLSGSPATQARTAP